MAEKNRRDMEFKKNFSVFMLTIKFLVRIKVRFGGIHPKQLN